MHWIRFFIAIIFFSSLNVHGQGDADDQTSRFNLQVDLGVSYLFRWDQSYITSSSLTDLDSRMVGNLGLGGRWNILKEAKYQPILDLNVNIFRSKASNITPGDLTTTVEFRNTFISYSLALSAERKVKIGKENYGISVGGFFEKQFFLIPYALEEDGKDHRTFYDFRSRPGGPYYRGPLNLGTVVGVNRHLGKFTIGLVYHQRVFFYGVNREISRLSLRLVL